MSDGNYVEVTVSAKDDTGPGFASADAKAAAFSRVVDQTLRKEISAHNAVTQAEQTHAKATSLLADAERVLAGESASLEGKLGGVGQSAASAERDVSALAGGGGVSGMGALIGAGVALSPVIATVGVGLGGLGVAAAGVLDPIKKAATATGGLQANLHTLDPEQQAAARSLMGLQKEYGAFEQALKPQVLGAWNEAMRIGGHLLGDIQPVAKATGNALDQVLGSVDREFQSGTWKQFFGWMAREAGPDVQQLGGLFTGLAQDLPPLVEGLQPVASGLIGVATDATKVVNTLNQWHLSLPAAGAAIGAFAGPLGALTGTLIGAGLEGAQALSKIHTAVDATIPSWTRSGQATTAAVTALRAYGPQVAAYIEWLHKSDQAGRSTAQVQAEFAHRANQAGFAAQQEAQDLSTLTGALTKGLSPLQSYIGATITQADDSRNLEKALKASGDRIGLNTQKQRDSFGAAQTYIGDLTTTASAAVASHQGIDKQISSIRNALPALEAVKGKTAGYNSELAQLKSYLDQLAAMKTITEYVNVVTRDVRPGGYQEFHAAGGVVSGAVTGGARSGRVIVGEHGREAVDLPTGSMVHSNPDTERMLSGASGGQVVRVQLEWAGGHADGEFMSWLARNIRVRGGDPRILTNKLSALK